MSVQGFRHSGSFETILRQNRFLLVRQSMQVAEQGAAKRMCDRGADRRG